MSDDKPYGYAFIEVCGSAIAFVRVDGKMRLHLLGFENCAIAFIVDEMKCDRIY